MTLNVDERANKILQDLAIHPRLGRFVDSKLSIPKVHRGSNKICLIIIGQDPTVKNVKSRAKIRKVLNPDIPGSLYNYLSLVCRQLGFNLQNIYATNYLKNFFKDPPTQITNIDIFKEFSPFWLPLLHEELAQFPDVPVITLGQPLLQTIAERQASPRVRDYWGYRPNWKFGEEGLYRCLEANANVLGRSVYPFPHQPSIVKRFYADRLEGYCTFIKECVDKAS